MKSFGIKNFEGVFKRLFYLKVFISSKNGY